MDSETPERPQPSIDWVSYHESQPQNIDVSSVVALVRRVGGELASIDEKKIDSSHRPALQIDKNKLIKDLQQANPQLINRSSSSSTQGVPPLIPTSAPPVTTDTQSTHVSKPQSTIHEVERSSMDISNIEHRLRKLESATKAFRSAKKIKRGTTYQVSSNSMKGQLKDASLLAEFVMSELANGVKTITIKLHETTDSEPS